MKAVHKVTIHHRQAGKTYVFDVEEGEYILRCLESQGEELPFSCRKYITSTITFIVPDNLTMKT